MTPFLHKIYHIKAMLLNPKRPCEFLKPFLSRFRANFYGNTKRNTKVTRFDSNCLFKEISLLMLTNQNKTLFSILTNQNKVLCIKLSKVQKISLKA